MLPITGLAQEAEANVEVDVNVEAEAKTPKNLGQAIKANCAGLTGLKRVVCLRETKKKEAKTQARGQSVRGRVRASKAFQSFEGARGMKIKDVGSGKRKQHVRTPLQKIGGKVQQMNAGERRKLKGQMNLEKITDSKREQNRRAKVESLKKRVHKR